ncbi:hypothetical protein IWQ61_006031, partial [Dispira simplex]
MTGSDPPDNNTNVRSKKPPTGKVNPYLKKPPSQRSLQTAGSGTSVRSRVTGSRRPSENGGTAKVSSSRRPSTSHRRAESESGPEFPELQLDLDSLFDSDGSFRFQDVPKDVMGELINHLMEKINEKEQNLSMSEQVSMTLVAEVDQKNARIRELESQLGVSTERPLTGPEGAEPRETVADSISGLTTTTTATTTKRRSFSMSEATESTTSPTKKSNPERRASETITAVLAGATISSDDTQAALAADEQAQRVVQRATKRFTELKREFQSMAPYLRSFAAPSRRGASDGLNVSHAKAAAFRKDGITEMLDMLNNQAKDPQQEITLSDNLTAPQNPSTSWLAWSKELNLATDLGNLLLLQVRHLQGKLSELEVEAFTQGERNDEMEKKVELQTKQISRMSEEYEAAKVRAWDMELVEQNLRDELKEATKQINRLQKENESLQKAFNNANDTVEQLRCSEEKLTKTIRNNRSRHEQDMNQARRNLISLQRDKKDLQKKVHELKADLSGRIQRSGGRPDGAGGLPSASTSPSRATAEPAEGLVDLGMHDGEDPDGFAYPRTPAQRRGLGNGAGWPPGSVPSTGPHAMHVQTLTGSLAHAHRTMDKLRGSLRRHKQENLELKLMLSEHQETIESLQRELTLADPGQTHSLPREEEEEEEATTTPHDVVDPVPGVDGVRRADQDWLDVDDDENVLSPRRTSFPIRPQTAGKRRRNPPTLLRHSYSHSTLSDQGQCSGAGTGPGSMDPTTRSTGPLLHKHPSQSSLGTPAAQDDVFGPSQGPTGHLSISSQHYNRFSRRTSASSRASLSAGSKSVGTAALDAELKVLDSQLPAGKPDTLLSDSAADSTLAVPSAALVDNTCDNSDISDSELLGDDSDPQVGSANRSTERRRRITKKRSFTRPRASRSGRQRRQSTHRRKLSPGEGAPQVAQSLSDILNTAAPPSSHLPLASPTGPTVEIDDDDDLTGSPLAHLPPPAVHRFDPTAVLESPLATRTVKGKLPQCPHCHGELGTNTVDSLLKTSSSDDSMVTVATQTEIVAIENMTMDVALTKDTGCQRIVDTQDASWGPPEETPVVTTDAQTATVAPALVDTATDAPLPSPLVDSCQQTANIHRTFGVQTHLTVAMTDQAVQTDSQPTDCVDAPASRAVLDTVSDTSAADVMTASPSVYHAECQTDRLPLPPTTVDKVTTTYEASLSASFWAQDASTHAAVITLDAGVGTVSPTLCTTGSQTAPVPQVSVSTETLTVKYVDAEVDAIPLPFSIEKSTESRTSVEGMNSGVAFNTPSPAKGRRMSLADSTALDMPFSGSQLEGQKVYPTLSELDERNGEFQPTRTTAGLLATPSIADVAASSMHSSHDDFATPDDYSSRSLARTDSIRSASPSIRPMMCARCRSTALVPVMASSGDSAVHIPDVSGRKRDSLPPLHDQTYLDVLASAKTSRTPPVGERRHSEGFLFTLSRRSTGRLLSPRSDASEVVPQRDVKLEQTLHTLEGRKPSQDALPSDYLVPGLSSAQLKPQTSFSSSIATTATSGGGLSVGYPAPEPVSETIITGANTSAGSQRQLGYGTVDNLETSVYSSTSPPLSATSFADGASLHSAVNRPVTTVTPNRVSCATQTDDVVVLPKYQGSGSPVIPTRSTPLRPTTSPPRVLLTKMLTLAPPGGKAIPPSTNVMGPPSLPFVPHRTMGDKPPLPPTTVRSLRTYGSLNNISQLTTFGTDTSRGQQTTLEMDSAPPLSLDQMITSDVGTSPGPSTPPLAPSSGRLPSQHTMNTGIFNRSGKRTSNPVLTPANHRLTHAPEDHHELTSTPASSMVTGLAPSTVPSPHVLQVPTRVMSVQPSRGTMAPSGHVIFEEGYGHAHPSATAGLLGPVGHRGSHMMLTADPLIIHAITQTMVGEFMWKSTRHKAGGVMRERRHLRFFWIHPYTKTIHWSNKAPGSEGGFLYSRNMAKSKSAYLKSVRVISDYQCTNENDLSPYSFIVQTSERELKFKAISRVRHDIWYQALSYLQTRPVISANTFVKNSVVLPQHRDKSHIVTHPNANSTSISVAMPPSHTPYSGPPVAYENTAVSGRLSSSSRRSPMLQSTGGSQGETPSQALGPAPDQESSGSSSARGRATPSIFKKSSYSYLLQKLSPYHLSPASAAPSAKRGDPKPAGSDRSRGPSPMDSPPWTRQTPEIGHAKTKRSFLSPPTMASLVPRRHSSNALGKSAQPQTQERSTATPWDEEVTVQSGAGARGAEADEGELTDQGTAPSGGITLEEGGRTPSKRKLITSLFSLNQPTMPPVPCVNNTTESAQIHGSSRAPSVSSLGLYTQQSTSDKGKQPTVVEIPYSQSPVGQGELISSKVPDIQ